MKPWNVFSRGLLLLCLMLATRPVEAHPAIACGETITANTTLTADLACPSGTGTAIKIDAPDITLDLGGHTLSGDPYDTGVDVYNRDGVTIRNGTIDGFETGILFNNSDGALVEHLTIRNLAVDDMNHFIFGVVVVDSQTVTVRESLFDFLPVAHKEAVEVYASTVDVNHIRVDGGGAGVSFSFIGTCDPTNGPSNGVVSDNTFLDIAVAGVWISCSSDLLIENNVFSTTPGGYGLLGIQGDAPFEGAVTGMLIRDNIFHELDYGIELRGILASTITNNSVSHSLYWGIWVARAKACYPDGAETGWECFNSTGNTVTDNFVLGESADLHHDDEISGNTWARNTCRVKVGAEIPECIPPLEFFLPLLRR
jgi:nitrous oxidase accessory protein NosD